MAKTLTHTIIVLVLTLLSNGFVFAYGPVKEIPTGAKDSLVTKKVDTTLQRSSITPSQNSHPLNRWQKTKTQSKQTTSNNQSPATTFRSFPELEPSTTTFHYDIWDNVAEFTQEYVASQTDENTQEVLDAASAVFSIIQEEQRFIDIIGGNEIIDLPVGLKQEVTKNSSISLGQNYGNYPTRVLKS